MTRTEIKVGKMSCSHCKMTVEQALGALKGVKSVEADLNTGIVNVEYEEDLLKEDTLKQVIFEAGYDVI